MAENTTAVSCDELVKEFSKGALVWYNFKPDCDILYLYNDKEDAAVKEFLQQKGTVTLCSCIELAEAKLEVNRYDYIVGIDAIEECQNPAELLKACHKMLKSSGRIVLGTENRYAIKYICGDRDPYTNHSFDGMENYRRLSDADRNLIAGRCYSMAELKLMLSQAGFENDKFYSVMPSLQETQLVYAEGYEPVEELAMRYFGMFHKMANAYIIECSMDGRLDDTLHATISLDRGHDNALVTSICEHDGVRNVIKRAVYKEGIHKLKEMQDNLDDLHTRGINVVDSSVENDIFIMPYVDAPVAMNELKAIAKKDKNAFLKAMDDMYELILNSSEHTGIISEKDRNSADGRDLGTILEKGYIDMVPLNCFYDGTIEDSKSRFIYYDQEFYWDNCPAKAIMYRSISIIYDGTDKEYERIMPRTELLDRYGLAECEDIWQRMSSRFTETLRKQKQLRPYYENKRIDGRILYTNREKINYSAKEYQKIFVDIFDGFDDSKKLILFGSGRFTERFLFQFAGDYNIYSIVDNNSAKWGTTMQGVPINSPDIFGQQDHAKWGTTMQGVPINSPDILKDTPEKDRHIIICIKGYNGVVNQLKDMGITDYHIYDPGNDYPNKSKEHVAQSLAQTGDSGLKESDMDKPYNVGYIAGVFDLFHIGHLNMFKRAKEQCRYLIVGVVSDEGVRLNKQAEPFVPFEERIEMVRSCRYVDEAVKLPLNFAGTRDMFKKYHFDVQFSGSDYEHDPAWLSEKEFLEKNGSTMVFFPYTQSTSSTKLKKAIESKIKQ